MTTLSRSSLAHVDFRQKWRQAIALLTMRRDKASRKHYIEGILTQIDGMRSTYERILAAPLLKRGSSRSDSALSRSASSR